MFPYPSGRLHMGHVRVYAIGDTMARYYRLRGHRVYHPIGFDSFGLPAENAALHSGSLSPQKWTESNIATMRAQLDLFNFSFDWQSAVSTCEPQYYKWTQLLFLKLLERGLVYQQEALVNWDPVDRTVLANEQVDADGRSWRSGAKIERRLLRQWFVKTSSYAKRLVDGLDLLHRDTWRDVIDLQRHWIGDCVGRRFRFGIVAGDLVDVADSVEVFTVKPEGLFGASFVAVSEDHVLMRQLERAGCQATASVSLDVGASQAVRVRRLPIDAVHPLTGAHLPMYSVAAEQAKGWFQANSSTHLGCPSLDPTDMQLALQERLPNREILDRQDRLINSEQFDGMTLAEARQLISRLGEESGFSSSLVSARLQDWLISRQRYWGTPIPIIHCKSCGAVPVPESDLPVELPKSDLVELGRSRGGSSPLADVHSWLCVDCPQCGQGGARRETDTMDTFVDSAWYYLRYPDSHNHAEPFSPAKLQRYMPVDLYVGGKEHAIMHLFFARFLAYFLHDIGWLAAGEPFDKLLVQGHVMGRTYRVKDTLEALPESQVDRSGETLRQVGSGALVEETWEKMSKSRQNGVDPASVVERIGVDSTRLYMLSNVAPRSHRKWDESQFVGAANWERRLWSTVSNFIAARARLSSAAADERVSDAEMSAHDALLADARNYYVRGVSAQLDQNFAFSTAIGRMQGLTSSLRRVPVDVMRRSAEFELALRALLIMLYPIAPHYAAEMWTGAFGAESSVWQQAWPSIDSTYPMPLSLRIGGEEVEKLQVPYAEFIHLSEEEAISLARKSDRLATYLDVGALPQCRFAFVRDASASLDWQDDVACERLKEDIAERRRVERAESAKRRAALEKEGTAKPDPRRAGAKQERMTH